MPSVPQFLRKFQHLVFIMTIGRTGRGKSNIPFVQHASTPVASVQWGNMADFYQFDSRWKSVRGGWGTLPGPARAIVAFFALPGILLAILSLILFAVSMLALLVLTVPVYRLLARLTNGGLGTGESVARAREARTGEASPFSVVFGAPADVPPSGTRRVDSTVVE